MENTKKEIYQKCIYEGFESSQVISIIDNICDDLDNNNHDFQMLLQDYNKLKRISKKNILATLKLIKNKSKLWYINLIIIMVMIITFTTSNINHRLIVKILFVFIHTIT